MTKPDEMKLTISSAQECFNVAQAEADRYQELVNALTQGGSGPIDILLLAQLTAKRDAASRIAQLIRHGVTGALLLLLAVAPARAQSLVLPTTVFGMAAATDWGSTYISNTRYGLSEQNRLINRLQDRPALMITAGATLDLAGVAAWNHYVGQHHKRIATAGLYVAAAGRCFFAARNINRSRHSFWAGHSARLLP